MANPKVEAKKIPAHEVMSTVESSAAALDAKKGKAKKRDDIRHREDIDRKIESPDRYVRRLAEVDAKLAKYKAEKRSLLQAILSFKLKLAMPDKAVLKASDAELGKGQLKALKAPEAKNAAPASSKPKADSK